MLPSVPKVAPVDEMEPVTRPRLLFACADASNRKAAARWLATGGFDVLVADDAQAALALTAESRPSIVVTDMALRDHRGRTVCGAIRELSDQALLPVLALCSSPREARSALDAGATEVLEHPFDWQVASVRAERLVHLARALDELDGARAEI